MKKLIFALLFLFPSIAYSASLDASDSENYIGGTAIDAESDAQFEKTLESSFDAETSGESALFSDVDENQDEEELGN